MSLKRQLADAQAGEEQQQMEVQIAHSQTDSAVAQLRGMQERLDALEVCITRNTVHLSRWLRRLYFDIFLDCVKAWLRSLKVYPISPLFVHHAVLLCALLGL